MADLGINCKIYRNTGDYGSPTWVEIDKVADATVNPAWDKADASSRSSRVKKSAKTQLGIEINGKVKVAKADAGYIALRDAMYQDTTLDLLVLNGPDDDNGTHGWRADWLVLEGPEDQAMANSLYMSFKLEPADTDNEPQYAEVSGGNVTFTEPGGDS